MAATTQACVENSPPTAPVCGSTLANNTFYYVYDKIINGVQTMVFSTSAYNVYNSPYGNAVMNGDPSASLIGILQTQPAAPTVAGSINQQNSASWFNPVWDGLTATGTGTFNNTGAYTAISSAQISYVQFSDNVVTLATNCVLSQNSGATIAPSFGVGFTVNTSAIPTVPQLKTTVSLETGAALRQVSLNLAGAIGSEGYIFASLLGLSAGGGSPVVSVSDCTLSTPSRMPS